MIFSVYNPLCHKHSAIDKCLTLFLFKTTLYCKTTLYYDRFKFASTDVLKQEAVPVGLWCRKKEQLWELMPVVIKLVPQSLKGQGLSKLPKRNSH